MESASQPASSNLLVIEIGNSHVSVADVCGGEIRTVQRSALDEIGEARAMLEPMWESLPDDAARAVVIGSVVPAAERRMVEAVEESLRIDPLVVGRDLRLPLSLALTNPEAVGVDRVCAAAAAFDRIGRACAVASFGTATTIDCVNDEGVFLGGAILPGLNMQARSLADGTAQLPLVPLGGDGSLPTFGGTTEEAIRNGIVFGAVGALRELVERYATELKRWPALIVTGGLGSLVAGACDFVDAVEPNLCIRGIALAHIKQFGAAAE